jgi:hypothetical protein
MKKAFILIAILIAVILAVALWPKQSKAGNGVFAQAVSVYAAGMATTIKSGYIMDYWTFQMVGVGGSGAATLVAYPFLCNRCTLGTTAAITVTGAGNTVTTNSITTPTSAYGMAVDVLGLGTATTITINAVAN